MTGKKHQPEITYERLIEEIPGLAKAVNAFTSENVQQAAFNLLVRTLGVEVSPDESEQGECAARISSEKKKPLRKVKSHSRATEAEPVGEEGGLDITKIANTLKEREDFSRIGERVLRKKDLWNKIRLVLLTATDPLSSGEITKVLREGLEVKTSQSSVSTCLGDNDGDLIRTAPRRKGGNRPRYRISAPGKKSAEEWLNDTLR